MFLSKGIQALNYISSFEEGALTPDFVPPRLLSLSPMSRGMGDGSSGCYYLEHGC